MHSWTIICIDFTPSLDLLGTELPAARHGAASRCIADSIFSDGGGWGNFGISSLVGITGAISPFLGGDAAVHMSEEIRDAGRALPKAMILTTVINGAMGFVSEFYLCFHWIRPVRPCLG